MHQPRHLPRSVGFGIAVVVAAGCVAFLPGAQAAAAPTPELPFACGTTWIGTTGSAEHESYEIDFNMAGTSGDGDKGKPVLAAAGGTVRWEGDAGSKLGNYLEIDHGDGYSTLYAHLDDKVVATGDVVRQGELIGTVGDTDGDGAPSTIDAHLHFEYRNRGSGQGYPEFIRKASFHGVPFDYDAGTNTIVSQNCGGNGVTSFPGMSAISRTNGALDVFAATTDGRVKHRNLTDGVWSCWSTLSSNVLIKGDPAAVYTPGRIDVFALGRDNRLKRLTWTTSHGWYPWVDMGADTFTSSPAVTSRSATGIDVFVKNNGNKIVYRHFEIDTGTWTTSWSYIGGNYTSTAATSGPAAVATPDGTRMNIFARDDDGSLISLMWTAANGWYSWVDRGGHLTGKPAASTRGGGGVDVFLRDQDDSLIHRHSPDGADWSTYPAVDFGGHVYTSPVSVSMSSQRIDVLSRNVEADLVRKAWTATNGWYAWAGHGPVGAPACS